MKITKHIQVPTGDILVVDGSKGRLEMLSLSDYGKQHNLKADFLGLERNLAKVEHADMMPLTEKWVVTISSQYGCSMGCRFCDVPLVGGGTNATFNDLIGQVLTALTQIHPEVEFTKRLNIHFARMGEPTYNPEVLDAARWLKYHIDGEYKCHPVVSTAMPRYNEWLRTFIHAWMRIKNRLYRGDAGLQLSINSTNEREREIMFNGSALSLQEIAGVMEGVYPVGRKITLNFAVADWEIDAEILARYFSPDLYVVKLTPMHKTKTAEGHGIRTEGDYTEYSPYAEHEANLKAAGFDVLVFVASEYEDLGRITCGNAILAGTMPDESVPHTVVQPET